MADAVLLRRLKLGCSQPQARDVKQRVVAESARAARCVSNFTVPPCVDDDWLCIVSRTNRDQYASVVRASLSDACQPPQQLSVIALIVRTLSRKAGRTYARGAAERLDT